MDCARAPGTGRPTRPDPRETPRPHATRPIDSSAVKESWQTIYKDCLNLYRMKLYRSSIADPERAVHEHDVR